MNDLLKIGAAFGMIILLLRLRWNLGVVMLCASVFLGALYRIGPAEQIKTIAASTVDPMTINLVTGLLLIMVLENIIRKKGVLKRMMEAVVNIFADRRIAMAALPAVIGTLPSAGGAAFSAPMVQEAAVGVRISPDRKAFVNYWFRHVWEYISPLYPGIVLAAALTHISINRMMLSQLPLPIAALVAGWRLGFHGVPAERQPAKRDSAEFFALFATLLPITASIMLVAVLHWSLAISMITIVGSLLLYYRYGFRELATTLRECLSPSIVLMVVGVMVFKGMLDASGAITSLPIFFRESGLPSWAVAFSLPFIVGLLTGITVAFVGATFPIIIALYGGMPEPGLVTFAFASGFAGVMLSPTHLCYVLTLQYFKADMAATYRLLYLPTAVVLVIGAFGMFF